jgi:hypothetical protein
VLRATFIHIRVQQCAVNVSGIFIRSVLQNWEWNLFSHFSSTFYYGGSYLAQSVYFLFLRSINVGYLAIDWSSGLSSNEILWRHILPSRDDIWKSKALVLYCLRGAVRVVCCLFICEFLLYIVCIEVKKITFVV